MTDIVFNAQQEAAIEKAVAWFRGWQDRKHRQQVFFLAGFAGTGKTSVARHIADLCAAVHRVVFIAPTGKAASRLRQKGCKNAKTMHQFIYNVRGEDEDGEPIFIGKGALEEKPLLVVMDEASMVGEYDNRSLLSHGIPILALGDTGQVKPVKQAAAYTQSNVDVQLTEIMRQAMDSNIVRASMFVREGKRLPLREYEDVKVRAGKVPDYVLLAHTGEDAAILCCFNTTRNELNTRIRKLLGYEGPLPQIGEKVVCLSNQHGHGFMNGEQGIVLNYQDVPESEYDDDDDSPQMLVRLKSLTNGKELTVKFNPLSFDKDEDVRKEAQKKPGGFDYGNVLTVHKAQGSEWPNVLVIEEAMRGSYAELMYTAITRAMNQLTMYRT